MKGVRFTKAEREFLVLAIETHDCTPKQENLRDAIKAKLELAEMPVNKPAGLKVADAISAFRGVLGRRLVEPPSAAYGVMGYMKQRIAALGLTVRDCETIAKVAAAEWRGAVKAESLVRQADRLLAASQQSLPYDVDRPDNAPVELDADDI